MKKEVDTIIDGHKIHLHPHKTAGWKEINDCYPIHVEIGATSRCNQKCIFCALDFINHRGIDIDREVMLRALEDMAYPKTGYKITFEYGDKISEYHDRVSSVMFGGEGEPTLHRDIGLFIKKAKEYGLDVALTTNGIMFDQRLQEECLPYLTWIKFSIDAGTPKTYNKIHRVPEKQFEVLFKNISDSVRLKRESELEVTVGTQFLMIPQNADEKEATSVIQKLKEINPDYLSVKPFSDHPRSKKNLAIDSTTHDKLEKIFNNLKSEVDFKIEFRKDTIERVREGNKYPKCYGLPFISLIDAKGDILPCNLFYGMDEFSYGNLYNSSFSEIWKGERRKNILTELSTKGVDECRGGCRCDAGNRYLHRLKNPESHDNFS